MTTERNPRHPSALTIEDIWYGRTAILYDVEDDTWTNATIMSHFEPSVHDTIILVLESGVSHECLLAEVGVTPYIGDTGVFWGTPLMLLSRDARKDDLVRDSDYEDSHSRVVTLLPGRSTHRSESLGSP